MNKGKGSVSGGRSYKEIGDFWDANDLANHWDETRPAKFKVSIKDEAVYYALDEKLHKQIRGIAKKKEISASKLLNLWVGEKIQRLAHS